MIQKGKSKITMFQLFFLSFAYVFSGLFLTGERSFLSLLVPLLAALIFAAFGFGFLSALPRDFGEKGRFSAFLSCGGAPLFGKILAVIFIFGAAAELLVTLGFFISSVKSFAAFIPVSLTAAILFLLTVFVGLHGLSVVGRFSETLVFLIVPVLFWCVFWDFHAMDVTAFSRNLHSLFVVMPGPVFYLLSMTAAKSVSMPSPPKRSALSFSLIFFSGAVLAVLLTVLFILFGAERENLFLLFLGWMASLVRLSLLFSFCAGGDH